jgi:tetraacyldisaccharide 4'-kinase
MPSSGIIPALLTPLAWLFAGAVRLRNWAYDGGMATVRRLPVPVISVGNLSVGGTGKTPVVILLAQRLAAAGHLPAVVLRGYGGSNARLKGGPPLLVADGRSNRPLATVASAGDEAILLARSLDKVPVVVAASRYRGGMEAIRSGGAGLIILDDGFQHRALYRDFDLLTMDATAVPFPGRLLPAGRLREPSRALARCHAVILTRADDDADHLRAREFICRRYPDLPVYRSTHRPARLRWLAAKRDDPPSLDDLRSLPVAAFAGLARPHVLQDTLAGLGARVVRFTPLPDHHRFLPGQVDELIRSGTAAGARLVITTAKDTARLPAESAPENLAILEIEVQVDGLDDLLARIMAAGARSADIEGFR